MLRRKLKWYKLFENVQELDALFSYRPSAVYRSMFGEVLLVKHESEYAAFRNKCPHQGKSMEGCRVIGDSVVCPFHHYHFSLQHGRGHGLYLDKYELRIDEDGVYLGKEGWSWF
jgi:nitrite reductase/ring-hydroxylating ferredoxin subunit